MQTKMSPNALHGNELQSWHLEGRGTPAPWDRTSKNVLTVCLVLAKELEMGCQTASDVVLVGVGTQLLGVQAFGIVLAAPPS